MHKLSVYLPKYFEEEKNFIYAPIAGRIESESLIDFRLPSNALTASVQIAIDMMGYSINGSFE